MEQIVEIAYSLRNLDADSIPVTYFIQFQAHHLRISIT